jgi:tRNA A37 threonylcarbamoyladenosine dehydratase
VRKRLAKDYGIEGGVTVITSSESPRKAFDITPGKVKNKASFYGTWACLPVQFGLHAASVVLNTLVSSQEDCGENKVTRELRTIAEAAAARY